MRKMTIALFLLAATAGTTQAQYMMYGLGTRTCSDLSGNFDPMLEALFKSWIGGFITGTNAMAAVALPKVGTRQSSVDVTGSVDLDIVIGYVKAYCNRNPGDNVAAATAATVAATWSAQKR